MNYNDNEFVYIFNHFQMQLCHEQLDIETSAFQKLVEASGSYYPISCPHDSSKKITF